MRKRLAWFGVLLGAGAVLAQEAAPPAFVARMEAYGDRYRASLPSLQCDEAIVSQEVKKGKVKQEVRIEGAFRVTRTGLAADPFEETHQYRSVNGGAVPKRFGVPYFLRGAFANGIGFTAETLDCYCYAQEDGAAGGTVVVSTRKADAEIGSACALTVAGVVRRTVVDADGNVVHVEVRTPEPAAQKMGRPYFAEIDYAPVRIGDASYMLPARVATHDEKDERRFEVRYSNFHRYGGAMTILPGAEKVPADQPDR